MASELLVTPARATDTNCAPYNGAKWSFYASGTSTPLAVYADAALTTTLGAVVTADGGGRFPPIYFNGALSYRGVLTNADGSDELDDIDPINNGLSGALIADNGADLMTFKRPEAGAVAMPVRQALGLTLHAAMFGVLGLPLLADDTTALQTAISVASSIGAEVILPPALRHGAVTLAGTVSLIGARHGTKVTANAGSYDLYTFTGNDCAIDNLDINEAAKTGGAAFKLACGTTGLQRIYVSKIVTRESRAFLTDSGSGLAGVHTTVIFTDCQAKKLRGHGVRCTRAKAFTWFERVTMDYVEQTDANYTGFSIDGAGLGADAGGINLIDCHVGGTEGVTACPNQRGFDIRNQAAPRMFYCSADNVCELGLVVYAVNGFQAQLIKIGLCGSHAMWLENVTNSDISGIYLYGRRGLSGAATGVDGIRIVSGCAVVSIRGGLCRDFTGMGARKAGVQPGNVSLFGIQIANNGEWGAGSSGAGSFVLFNCVFGGNTLGDCTLGGGTDYAVGCIGNSGTPFSIGPGPITH